MVNWTSELAFRFLSSCEDDPPNSSVQLFAHCFGSTVWASTYDFVHKQWLVKYNLRPHAV